MPKTYEVIGTGFVSTEGVPMPKGSTLSADPRNGNTRAGLHFKQLKLSSSKGAKPKAAAAPAAAPKATPAPAPKADAAGAVSVKPVTVEARLSGPEITAVQTYDLASGQTDPLPVAISLALAEVRGYIPSNCLNADTTLIPPELKDTAIIITIEKLSGRLSGGGLIMSENRRQSFEIAIQRLRDTARGNYHVEPGIAVVAATDLPDSDNLSWTSSHGQPRYN